jgi:hypothetical protein
MKKLFLGAIVLAPLLATAQTTSLDTQTQAAVKRLERRATTAERQAKESATAIHALRAELHGTAVKLDTAIKAVEDAAGEQAGQLQSVALGQEALSARISQEAQRSSTQETELQGSIVRRTNALGGVLGGGFLVLAALAAMGWQRQREGSKAHNALAARFDDVARAARASEERAAKADTSIAGSLFEVLTSIKAQALVAQAAPAAAKPAEPDHNLPSKLADEIHRMRKRLATLPEDTKGLTPLKKSLERLEAELAAYGYEIIDHTGRAYSDNMSIKARFIPSEDLGRDQRVISKVVIPQLNHQGVMVRMADVEVSIGS